MAKKKKGIKIRRTWDINPVERVKTSDKAYYRNREKRSIKQVIREELNGN